MSGSSVSRAEGGIRKRNIISVHEKLKLIEKLEHGASVANMALEFGIGTSTVSDIRKQKDKLLKIAADSDNTPPMVKKNFETKPRLYKDTMATSSKKITYTSDFKLKVLDYYFKNGGDENFGLKKKTAGHFNIDKKTINRMLNNPDMVKRARKLLSKRATGSSKGVAASRPGGTKATTKGTKASGSKVSTSGAKLGTVSTSGKATGSSHTSASNTSSSIVKAPTSSTTSTKNVGGINKNSQASSSGTQTAIKPSTSKIKFMGQDVKSGVQVFDLPEDPDYSILKQSINASVNGVANVARLLVTGTEEVCKIILNECDMILECKVCHNLFRSVVNFIAHKRIYCQEEFADVRALFHKDDIQGITSHSSTVFVEPEPPPDVHPSTSSAPDKLTKSARSAMQGASRHSGIDSIAAKLTKRRKQRNKSHASHTGSSQYYERLDHVNIARDKLSRDCSVVLEDIGGVTNARYQTFVPPSGTIPKISMNAVLDEVSQHSAGLTVAINEHGVITKTAPGNVRTIDVEQSMSSCGMSKELICHTCNTRFATQKTLSVHQRSHHGFERCIYCCPICKTTFLSMWAVVKHLQRFHKKKKSQTERLRKVIKKNVYKKMVYHSEDHQGQYSEKMKSNRGKEKFREGDQETAEEEIDMEENRTFDEPNEMEVASLHKSTIISSSRKCSPTKSPLKRDDFRSGSSPEHRCVKCNRRFMTASALISHDKFCSLLQMRPDILKKNPLNPRLRSETPEKKIAIQIRKDYKKTMKLHSSNMTNYLEENPHNQITFKVPEIPKEQEKENQRKIEMMMSEFCNMTRLTCIPCEKRYQTVTTLKRHASQHFSWTRFACKLCKFRSYHKYESVRHCISDHKANEHTAGAMIFDDESFGPLKYFLVSEDDTSISSDADELESHGSRSRSTSASSDRLSIGLLNDTKNSIEKNDATVEDIRPTLVFNKYVNMSNAENYISNEMPELPAKETETVDDNKKIPEFKGKAKIINKNPSDKPEPSMDSSKSLLEDASGNLLHAGLAEHSIFGLQENLEESCVNQSIYDGSKVIQVSGISLNNDLSEININYGINNTISESKQIKDSTNVKPYPLRGQSDSTNNSNQFYEDEETRFERPQRLRRSVEQKDFIYDIKRSGLQKAETEVLKRSSILKKELECKSNGKPGTRRRNSFPRGEILSKKIKNNDTSAACEACNGTDTQLHVQNKCVSIQSGSPGKESSSHLLFTKFTDISSVQQHPQIEEQHLKLELPNNSDADKCTSAKNFDTESPFLNNKPGSSHNSNSASLLKSAAAKKLLTEGCEEGNSNLISEEMDTDILEMESATNTLEMELAPNILEMESATNILEIEAAPNILEMESAPNILEMESAPNILEMESAPNILEMESATNILEMESATNILEMESATNILEMESATNILEMESATNILEMESATNILEMESANVNNDKVLEGDINEDSLIGPHIFENGKIQENCDRDKNEAEEAESNMLSQLNKCEDMSWEEEQEKSVNKDNTEEEKDPEEEKRILQTVRNTLNVPDNDD